MEAASTATSAASVMQGPSSNAAPQLPLWGRRSQLPLPQPPRCMAPLLPPQSPQLLCRAGVSTATSAASAMQAPLPPTVASTVPWGRRFRPATSAASVTQRAPLPPPQSPQLPLECRRSRLPPPRLREPRRHFFHRSRLDCIRQCRVLATATSAASAMQGTDFLTPPNAGALDTATAAASVRQGALPQRRLNFRGAGALDCHSAASVMQGATSSTAIASTVSAGQAVSPATSAASVMQGATSSNAAASTAPAAGGFACHFRSLRDAAAPLRPTQSPQLSLWGRRFRLPLPQPP